MSLIKKSNLDIVIQTFNKLFELLSAKLSTKLGKTDYYTDDEILQFLSESINLSPLTENGNYLVEGDAYLVL
jgi:hypothetical protein